MVTEKRKVWFVPNSDESSCRGHFSKEVFFEIRYNTIHNPTGYTLTCKRMRIGNYKLFSPDMETAKRDALKSLQQMAEKNHEPKSFCDFINKYEI